MEKDQARFLWWALLRRNFFQTRGLEKKVIRYEGLSIDSTQSELPPFLPPGDTISQKLT